MKFLPFRVRTLSAFDRWLWASHFRVLLLDFAIGFFGAALVLFLVITFI